MTTQRHSSEPANPLLQLHDCGQAVWLDFLSRRFIADGSLAKLVDQDGLSGVTSNPSIFQKAVAGSADYDAPLKDADRTGDRDVMSSYEAFAIEDIQHAADVLRPVFERTRGQDGYVSLEVSPYRAMDTDATISEARRLWKLVDRANVMIKVPATKPGLPAIRELLGDGINVNITLLFSQAVYEEVIEAYLTGLERVAARGGDPSKVASVASFFVSRIDSAVDRLLDERMKTSAAGERAIAAELRGKIAIANAKLAYQSYKQRFAGPRWEKLRAKGARVQRLLWASTGVKDPAYRDVLYVEQLIAPDTVNTLPPATLDAFRDHGRAHPTLEENIEQARRQMAALDSLGIDLDGVTDRLVVEGVELFSNSFDQLLGAVARKKAANLGTRLNGQTYTLPKELEKSVTDEIEAWRRGGNGRRLWNRDAGLWTGHDEAEWLGWLDIVDEQRARVGDLNALAAGIRKPDFDHVVLLGMGGSSLGPEVLAQIFRPAAGHPHLLVLDSTDPAQIRSIENGIDIARTLFLVSSKSGTTLEPNILKQYFFARVTSVLGAEHAGSRFMAITDPGSKLEEVAARDRFRAIAFGKASIGGRYSVLSDFGMVPAALIGLDLDRLLASTQLMQQASGPSVPPAENPAITLGIILGQSARTGRDKVTIVASPGISDFGAWLEQLLAESTGKLGKGVIPVDAEPLGPPEIYGRDRLFVYLRLASAPEAAQDQALATIEQAGNPLVRITVGDRHQIGQEFFRWELATAVAGAVLGINPFNQPDVEASKIRTRELTADFERTGKLPAETPLLETNGIRVFADAKNASALEAPNNSLSACLKAHLNRLGQGEYCALLAYVERNATHTAELQDMRRLVRDSKRVATCLGFGPRFLHSTGQAYKGGPNSGVFLQITSEDADDLPVPGQRYTFGNAKAAEARGDLDVLAERGRRVLRIHLGADVAGGLRTLKAALREALD